MKRPLLVLLLAVVLVGSFLLILRLRKSAEPLALVDDVAISADDFQARFKKYLESTGQRDNILTRKRVLDNMINEQLIYADIRRQGIDQLPDVRDRLRTIEEEALALRYAKHLIVDSLKVTPVDLAKEFSRYKVRVHARYLYAKSVEEAEDLKRRLDAGATFEALAKEVFRDPGLAGNGGDLGFFGWGEMEPALEEACYTLPVGVNSAPVRLKIGWAIVRVERRIDTNPLASQGDFATVQEKLGDAIVKRRLLNFTQSAGDSIERAMKPVFDENGVHLALKYYDSLVVPVRRVVAVETPIPVPEDTTALMTFSGGRWTLKDFFATLRHTTERERRYLKTPEALKKYAIGLAAREIILRRSRDEGFDRDTNVQKQIRRTTDEYLLRRWSASVSDTVGQHGLDSLTLRRYYQDNLSQFADPPQVNVAEILVRTRTEAAAIRRELDRGAVFADLARKKSIRLWAAKKGGELGFGTKANYGVLGDTFFAAGIGAIIGPAFVDPYYGVFRILARREGRARTFDEARDDVIAGAAFLRKQEVLRDAVTALRAKARVTINSSVLEHISLH